MKQYGFCAYVFMTWYFFTIGKKNCLGPQKWLDYDYLKPAVSFFFVIYRKQENYSSTLNFKCSLWKVDSFIGKSCVLFLVGYVGFQVLEKISTESQLIFSPCLRRNLEILPTSRMERRNREEEGNSMMLGRGERAPRSRMPHTFLPFWGDWMKYKSAWYEWVS